MDVLKVPVGYGVTGHVVASGEPVLAGDAAKCEWAQMIPGTQPLDESLLAVPLHYGTRVIGASVKSAATPSSMASRTTSSACVNVIPGACQRRPGRARRVPGLARRS